MTDPYLITIAALYVLGGIEFGLLAHAAHLRGIKVSVPTALLLILVWPVLILYALLIGILDAIKTAKDKTQ